MGDMPNFKDAYDAATGKKLPNKVPEQWFGIFPNLRKTPKQRSIEKRQEVTPKPDSNERGK